MLAGTRINNEALCYQLLQQRQGHSQGGVARVAKATPNPL